jgi:hypothetical protein
MGEHRCTPAEMSQYPAPSHGVCVCSFMSMPSWLGWLAISSCLDAGSREIAWFEHLGHLTEVSDIVHSRNDTERHRLRYLYVQQPHLLARHRIHPFIRPLVLCVGAIQLLLILNFASLMTHPLNAGYKRPPPAASEPHTSSLKTRRPLRLALLDERSHA